MEPREQSELRQLAETWIDGDPDPATRDELRGLLARLGQPAAQAELADRFAASLEFGTAGLRGVLGAGPNRMNRAVVIRASWALAQELLAAVPRAADRGVLVGGDARRMSRELAEDTAAVLAAAGLRVFLCAEPVPTPFVSFAVKRLGAAGGVIVTASHNPPEYNGYKVYWDNAAQIVPPTDGRIAAAIARAPSARAVERPPLEELRARARVIDAPADLTRAYLDAVRALSVHPNGGDRSIRIVYTPLHGVGDGLARAALAEAGFANVASVPEQQKPDGAFPTVAFPNPEEPGAMDLAFALAAKTAASLVLANDPDADRLAVAEPPADAHARAEPRETRAGGEPGEAYAGGAAWRRLSGNEIGTLLGHYLLTERPSTRPRVVIASIVSSPLLGRIASSLGVRYEETLTGFKWIANRAMELEREGYEFVFGYEEALGYCAGDVVRDKDGISAAVLVAEMAAVLRARGRTLHEELEAIARRWGVFLSAQVNVVRKGAAGVTAIRHMMDHLRAAPPTRIADDDVVAVADYVARQRLDVRAGSRTPLSLPASSVVAFELASGSRIIARPSGTEPKAKFYFDVREEVGAGEAVHAAAARAEARRQRLAAAFEGILPTTT
jgi:phosphomannomutase